MVAGLGKLSYLSVHLFVIGVGAIKRGMSEDVPELVSASLSTSESIKNEVNTSRPPANRKHNSEWLEAKCLRHTLLWGFALGLFLYHLAVYP